MIFGATLVALAVALLWPLTQTHRHVFPFFWTNAPGRLTEINNLGGNIQVKFSNRIRSCEDVLLVESKGLAILACDPGRERWNTVMGIFLPGPVANGELYIYDYAHENLDDEKALRKITFVDFALAESDFHSLGLAYDEASSTLFVANHRHDAPAIEQFKLDLKALTATHVRSIQHPSISAPNAIALVNEHELYVTNDHHFLPRYNPILNKIETYLSFPGGTVTHVVIPPTVTAPVTANTVTQLPFANGIELLNTTTAAVASTIHGRIYFYSISKSTSGTPIFTKTSHVTVNFLPDNLSQSKDGALIIAGHAHAPSLEKFARSRALCNGTPDEKKTEEEKTTCAKMIAPSWAARWTEDRGVEDLYASYDYPSSATAVRDSERGFGIISGLYAKGILVWRD
ncbi:putative paraoxonase [Xylariaceae sp. FL0255]|nr:putative paraoxonase [Xylariaceae sp. FL0255]